MGRERGKPYVILLIFAVLSLAAVGIGAFVCAANGVPAGSWLRNVAAWGVGGLAALGLAAAYRPAFLNIALWAAPLGLAAAFFNPDQEGVHRWIDVGPVHTNVAMLLLPAAVVALAAKGGEGLWPWLAAMASLALLVAQPDASQATSLAAVAVLVALAAAPRPGLRWSVIVAAVALAAFAWTRPDPLQPVAEVEEVLQLAFGQSLAVGVLAALLLLAACAAPAVLTRTGPMAAPLPGLALGLCFLAWAAMPLLGAFPVPFVGIGMSPIVGAWLGMGLLAGLLKPAPFARMS